LAEIVASSDKEVAREIKGLVIEAVKTDPEFIKFLSELDCKPSSM
jgi:hypothetical protein